VDEHTWEIEQADSTGQRFNVYRDHRFFDVVERRWCIAHANNGRVFIDLATGEPWAPDV
jgi:hypothetical protein